MRRVHCERRPSFEWAGRVVPQNEFPSPLSGRVGPAGKRKKPGSDRVAEKQAPDNCIQQSPAPIQMVAGPKKLKPVGRPSTRMPHFFQVCHARCKLRAPLCFCRVLPVLALVSSRFSYFPVQIRRTASGDSCIIKISKETTAPRTMYRLEFGVARTTKVRLRLL